METPVRIDSRFPNMGTTIFTVMSRLATECGAINLSQGFPDFQAEPVLFDAMHRHMLAGRNQYAPMAGLPELRQAIVDKVAALYGTRFDVESEVTVTAGATQAIFTAIAEEDVAQNAAIGQHGLKLWKDLIVADGQTLNVMTHCNAGWLATVDWGTALSPVYAAHDAGVPVHVWVSETRPRNQGLLTAWELEQHGVPHTLIADNAAGLLMRQGKVDVVIVGADRIAANGDVANKVGTYLKALACADNGIPFYVAAPRSTLDFACPEGADIPIEERDGDEFRLVHGLDQHAQPTALRQLPAGEDVANPAFDVTPNWLVKAIITERGTCAASREGLLALYPEEARG